MHTYRYYPAIQVYFAMDRKVYYYLDGGAWQISATLPRALRVQLGSPVVIEMDSDRPYRDFDTHKAKYPPGKQKKRK
ncbi:hypothetical protein ACHHRT_03825 [Desulfurivibrio sp. D14AmB]|uniref:hypothetical protein n=1 Tax=Desulfurivibrio sp. D14AmB TaxID=3374370 RepID=UPI00376ED6F0